MRKRMENVINMVRSTHSKSLKGRSKPLYHYIHLTLLCAFLSLLWVLYIPQLIETVYAEPITVNDLNQLNEALAHASTDPDSPTEIVMGKSFEASAQNVYALSGYAEIDLNGKTLTLVGDRWISLQGNLIIKDSGTSGTITGTSALVISIFNGASLNLEGGSIINLATNGIGVHVPNGTFVMSGGEVKATGSGGRSVKIPSSSNGSFTQKGGVLTGAIEGTYTHEGGTNDDYKSVTFYKNDGSDDTSIQYVHKNTETNLTANTFTWSGHTFKGWSDSATATIATYTNGQSVTFTENTKLYAVWEGAAPTTYTVTMTNDGNGTASASPTSGAAGTNVEITATVTASNYHFKEWQVISGEVTLSSTTTNPATFDIGTANVEIKAIFEQNPSGLHTITVTNDGNGTGSADKQTETCEGIVNLTATPNTDYVFDCWTSNDVDINNSTSANEAWFRMADSNVTVKANFKPASPTEKCTITFDKNGGSGTMNPQQVNKGTATKLRKNTFTRNGYDFKNWNTKSDGSGTSYADEGNITANTDMTLYAQWKKDEPGPTPTPTPTVTPTPTPTPTPRPRPRPRDNDDDDIHESEPAPSNNNNIKIPDGCEELRQLLVNAAASGKPQTVKWNKGTSLPADVILYLHNNPNLTLEFTYTYGGDNYVVTIPGRNAIVNPSVDWYGPVYLYILYGGEKTPLVTTTASTGTYTVKSGDTLSAIAKRLKTTVKHLKDVNNIKNVDKIKPGMVLKY